MKRVPAGYEVKTGRAAGNEELASAAFDELLRAVGPGARALAGAAESGARACGCCTNRGLSAPPLTIAGMGQNFIECDREQEFLLPPSLREWLPEGHLDVTWTCDDMDGRAEAQQYLEDELKAGDMASVEHLDPGR